SVKKAGEIKRINTQKFSSDKIENDNLNSLHNSSDEMLQMAASAGEYEKVFKKEARGIHNVMNNGKRSTLIKRDLDSIDSAIKFERGFNNKNNKGYGAKHIIKHTINKDAKGYITDIELVNLGKNIREYIKNHKEPFIDKNGARIYEWENSDGVRFRAVVGDIQSKAPTTAVGSENGLALRERIITFYSDRNLNEPMNFKNPKLNKENSSRRDETTSELPQPTATDDIITFYSDRNLNEPMNFKNPNLNQLEWKGQEIKQADIRGGKAQTAQKQVINEKMTHALPKTSADKQAFIVKNSTTTANKSQENILKGVDGKEYPNTIAGRWEKRVDEAFDWAYKNIYAKGVKSGIKGAEFAGRAFGSQETGAKIQRGLEKTFALQDEIGALNRLKSAYLRNSAVARVEAMKVYESLVKLEIDERVALFRMLDGQEVEPNLAGKLRPTYQKLRDKIDERAELLIKLGMLKGQNAKENYIKYSYSQYYGKKDGALGGFGIGKLRARDENLSYEDRVKLGLIEDAAIAVTQTLNSQNNQIQKAILLKSLADEYAIDQPKDGYVKVSDESVGGGVKKYGA
ncbi:MAG: hypothetical protein IJ965_10045, partial [Campylobacter sp.]|nr:hypothetical protein [Campylobacter sp.]